MPSERRPLIAPGLRVASVGIAGLVLAVAAAAAGLGVSVPSGIVPEVVLATIGAIDSGTASAIALVGLPAALVAALLIRTAVTRTHADAALAAFATPCLLACVWAVHAAMTPGGGVAWGRPWRPRRPWRSSSSRTRSRRGSRSVTTASVSDRTPYGFRSITGSAIDLRINDARESGGRHRSRDTSRPSGSPARRTRDRTGGRRLGRPCDPVTGRRTKVCRRLTSAPPRGPSPRSGVAGRAPSRR